MVSRTSGRPGARRQRSLVHPSQSSGYEYRALHAQHAAGGMSSWACVLGRRTPRPRARHVVHAWNPDIHTRRAVPPREHRPTHVQGRPTASTRSGSADDVHPLFRGRPTTSAHRVSPRGPSAGSGHAARALVQDAASAIDSASRPPSSHAAQQCNSHRASPSLVPAAKPAAASWYSLPRRRCPTSGTANPLGSKPVLSPVSRAAALATTPLASSNGETASSSPCTTATSTGPGTELVPTSRPSSSSRSVTPPIVLGRPNTSSRSATGTRSVAASTCSLASACSGALRHTGSSRPSSSATRSAPANTGSDTTPSTGSPASPPSSAAEARAARTLASAAVAGQPRRLTGCACALATASLARATASATPGSSTSGASGSAVPLAGLTAAILLGVRQPDRAAPAQPGRAGPSPPLRQPGGSNSAVRGRSGRPPGTRSATVGYRFSTREPRLSLSEE